MPHPAEAFDLDIGETVAMIDSGPSYDSVLAVSPDGQRVVTGDAYVNEVFLRPITRGVK